jgi:RNA polymerase sigma-70 factor (TIGR02947 family)
MTVVASGGIGLIGSRAVAEHSEQSHEAIAAASNTGVNGSTREGLADASELAARFTRDAEPLIDVLSRGARKLTRCDADAEDLLQDALLHAYRGFRTFQEGSNLKAWLFRILYNRWVTTYRAKQSRPLEVLVDHITEWELVASAARRSETSDSAESEALKALPDNEIEAAMNSLPEAFRKVVYYADVQGYTYAETATIMNIPMGTVMSRAARGRKRLRTALVHIGDGDRAAI